MLYLRQSENDAALYAAMDQIWETLDTGRLFTSLQEEQVYKRITSDPRFINSRTSVNEVFTQQNKRWLYIAASVLLVCSIGLCAYLFTLQDRTPVPAAYVENQVQAGQRMQIKLSDGTVVYVNSASKIRYPSSFPGKTREIYLEGEAYFDVAHDADKPFIVHTGNVQTRVLGTKFNITAYGKDEIRVAVSRGKVSVGNGKTTLGLLTPNRQLKYNLINGKVDESAVDAEELSAWRKGDLIFNNVSMEEAAAIIERTYNVKFNFSNRKLARCRISASFLNKEDITQILRIMSQINSFHYRLNNGEVKITGRGC